MYVVQTYTFTPGGPGSGTIEIPDTLQLEDFGTIINVTRNSIIYNPAEGNAGATLTHVDDTTVLTLEQSTTYCEAEDKLQIIVLGDSGSPGGTVITGTLPRTPTTVSISSSASSVTIFESSPDRKGLSVANVSTSNLYLSFSDPATTANCFIQIPGGAFILLDQQLIVPNAIYGLWDSANGSAQATEFV